MSPARAGIIAALLAIAATLGACSSDADEQAATRPVDEPAAASTPPPPPPPPEPDVYAVIANINPFGDACAGSKFEHVAEELAEWMHEAGLPATIRPSGEYLDYRSGGYCVEAGRSKSRRKAEALVHRLENTATTTGAFPAQILVVE